MRINKIIRVIVFAINLAILAGCAEPVPDTENQKPIAIITPATDQSVLVSDTINFSGDTSSDPDLNTPLSYEWSFTGALTSVQTSTNVIPGQVTFSENGLVIASLVVTDNLGLSSDPASITIRVTDVPVNLPPNGSINHDNGDGTTGSTGNISINTGTSAVFNGSAVDPENDAISYAWVFQGATASSTAGSGPITATYNTAGTFLVTLTATDSNGNIDPTPAQISVTVTDAPVNLPPNGSISHDNGNGSTGSTGNVSIDTGASIVFIGSAVDPESDPVTYAWNIPVGVTAPASPGSSPFTANFPTAGNYNITLTVSDDNGNADPTPAQITVTVTDAPAPDPVNLPPNGSISHDNGDGTTGSTGNINITTGIPIVFNGSAVDPENDPVIFTWIFNGAATASATTGSGPISVTYTTPGTFVVSLTVSDNNGNSDPTPAQLTVNVSLPEFKYLPVLNDEDGNPNDGAATYTLNVEENINVNVATPLGSWTTPMMRYNGLQLPPVIVAKRGTQMTFNVNNNLTEDTTVHWHGFQVPGDQDGGPDFPIIAGESRTYNFELVQPAGPLWFHPHAHGTTATQVYNGLAGGFVITDDITQSLESNNQIPSDNYDIPLLIQDRLFTADNGAGVRTLIYQAGGGMMGGGAGMLGDRVLVNSVEMPGLKVDTHQYRFRIYNGSNARTYDLALDDNSSFTVVATDGGLLDAPVTTDHIMLAAGERAEIVVNFGNYTVGDNVMLVSRAFNTGGMMGGGGALPNGAAFNVMSFDIETQVTDDVVLYASLPTNADINNRLTANDADTTRDFVMSMVMQMGGMQFLINGVAYDMNRVDEVVLSGATEIWNVSNTSGMAHPFHAHAIQWQVLDRNGVPASGVDLGWKDTVLVQSGENVRLIGHFDPVVNKGRYMYHCHILEHEEDGMMGTFEVQ